MVVHHVTTHVAFPAPAHHSLRPIRKTQCSSDGRKPQWDKHYYEQCLEPHPRGNWQRTNGLLRLPDLFPKQVCIFVFVEIHVSSSIIRGGTKRRFPPSQPRCTSRLAWASKLYYRPHNMGQQLCLIAPRLPLECGRHTRTHRKFRW